MVPRPRNPFRKPKDDASSEAKKPSRLAGAKIAGPKPASSKETSPKAEPKKPDEAAKTAVAAPAPTPAVAAKKPPAPNVQERIEGLQGWMAEIERKQGRMTYFGAAALLVAVLASAAAIYLGITNQQNSADKDDFESLETRVTEIGDSLKSSTEEQLKTLNSNLAALEQRLDAIDQKQKQTDTAIQDLQKQINQQAAATNDAAAQGTTTPTAPATPDTKP